MGHLYRPLLINKEGRTWCKSQMSAKTRVTQGPLGTIGLLHSQQLWLLEKINKGTAYPSPSLTEELVTVDGYWRSFL